jgi:type II restriction enzyme
LKTREIIQFVNQHFGEHISSGSYDDIRRKDLKLLVLAGLIINSGDNPQAATNDPTRGYALEPTFKRLVQSFKTPAWTRQLASYLQGKALLSETLARRRALPKVPVTLPDGTLLELSPGAHNTLQKSIVEEFLPRFGQGCQILYIGDTARKILRIEREVLARLNFFELSHEELPDIIAYHPARNWLYLIEAVYSSGPLSEIRVLELKRLTQNCAAQIVFVTAFATKDDFRKWMLDIAWETEVWIAEQPDHLIHFDGEKYLSPYEAQ